MEKKYTAKAWNKKKAKMWIIWKEEKKITGKFVEKNEGKGPTLKKKIKDEGKGQKVLIWTEIWAQNLPGL